MRYCEKLMRPVWQTLEKTEQESILQQIGKENNMVYQYMKTFSRWGLETTTAVYIYQDSEFVFVPGDTVTLGWNGFTEGMDAETKAFFEEDLADWHLEEELELDLETYLKSVTSEIRQRTIVPMFVERKAMEFVWEMEDENNDMDKKQICNIIEKQGGFRLPNTDEWEYLAGGGKRTLFQWGDGMAPYIVKDDLSPIDTKGELESPNFFGIIIGDDSYCMELISDGLGAKGGDGGCACCGGLMMMSYLACSPYYYDKEIMEALIDETYHNSDFEFVRRVKTIIYDEN